jgi:hypothetical protein
MSDGWLPIRYRDFYDIPRAFVVEQAGELLFFDCPFSETLSDYPENYTVYRLNPELKDRLDTMSWADLASQSECRGLIPTKSVRFDATKRAMIDAGSLALIRH